VNLLHKQTRRKSGLVRRRRNHDWQTEWKRWRRLWTSWLLNSKRNANKRRMLLRNFSKPNSLSTLVYTPCPNKNVHLSFLNISVKNQPIFTMISAHTYDAHFQQFLQLCLSKILVVVWYNNCLFWDASNVWGKQCKFDNIYLSQGTVVTFFRCGGNVKCRLCEIYSGFCVPKIIQITWFLDFWMSYS